MPIMATTHVTAWPSCEPTLSASATPRATPATPSPATPNTGIKYGVPVSYRVVFYRGSRALSIDGARMPLSYGREFMFLEILAERRSHGEVTPPTEHGIDWKNAVDRLRRRIRKATGNTLLPAVVLCAKGPGAGYRLAPGVRVRND